MLTSEGTPPEALRRHTGFVMSWIANRSRATFMEGMAELGLRPPHFGVLSVIASEPGLTQQELVGRLRIDPSTMVQMLDALEEHGWAERRPHPTDRRKRALHLTPVGEELLPRAQAVADRAGDEMFAALDAQERAELERLLEKMAYGAPGVS